VVAAAVLVAGLLLLPNCGTGFKLPAEDHRASEIRNGRYERIDTWPSFTGVHDLLLTKSAVAQNEQLFVLFNSGPPTNTGRLVGYPLATPTAFTFVYPGLQHPVAVCGSATRLFVLDQGDSCAARWLTTSIGSRVCATTGLERATPPLTTPTTIHETVLPIVLSSD